MKYIVIDLETSAPSGDPSAVVKENTIVSVQWKTPTSEVKISRWADVSKTSFLEDFCDAEVVVGHHLKFDMSFLHRFGYDIPGFIGGRFIWDTQTHRKLMIGNLRAKQHLEATCGSMGLPLKKDKDLAYLIANCDVASLPWSWIESRAKLDIVMTEELFKRQYARSSETIRQQVYTKSLFSVILGLVSFEGLRIDRDKALARYNALSARCEEISRELSSIYGEEFNPGSSKQKISLLVDKLGLKVTPGYGTSTPKGALSVGDDSLQILKKKTKNKTIHKAIELLLEYSTLNAKLSKFFKPVLSHKEDRIYAEFSNFITATHRVSSTKIHTKEFPSVQFQNIPREERDCIVADDGYVLFEIDMSQAEFLAAGLLSNDPKILEDYYNKYDVHRYTASCKYHIPMEEVTKEQRTNSKSLTFTPLYDGQGESDDDKAYVASFREKYSVTRRTQLGWVDQAIATGKIEFPWGVTFYFPNEKLKWDGRAMHSTQIFNYPGQNFATAECSSIATILLFKYLRETQYGKLINVVHDNLIVKLRPDPKIYEEVVNKCKEIFQKDIAFWLKSRYNCDIPAVFRCEWKIGRYWGDGSILSGEF